MTEMTPEQERFQEFLHAQGYSLSNFSAAVPSNLFPNQLGEQPDFFKQNLVSPHRVLKVFQHDPHANIKIFYYQLLCVTFQIQTENGFNTTFMHSLIHIVFHNDFEIYFSPESESQRDLYCDFQFKKLFAEFVSMTQNEESPNIEQIINSYPIMDTVFVHIFRSILATQGINYAFNEKIPTDVVFSELSALLGLGVESFNASCWKFADSDMFCYEHAEDQLYLAFTRVELEDSDAAEAYSGNYSSSLPSQPKPYEYSNPIQSSYPDYSSNSYSSSYQPVSTSYDPNPISSYQPQPTSSYQPAYEAASSYTPTRSNFQSLSEMADRHVNVQPKHDIVETLKPAGQDNQVKESMISVTYEFVDFTGESTAYKDRVPKRLALANASGLAQAKPADAGVTKSSGLDQYMTTKPADSLANYNVTSSIPLQSKFDSYKPVSIDPLPLPTYTSPLPPTTYTSPLTSNLDTYKPATTDTYQSNYKYDDSLNSLYKSAAPVSSNYTYDTFKPTEVYGSQSFATANKQESYTTSYTGLAGLDTYKPSTALDGFSSAYQPKYDQVKPSTAPYEPKYDPKPLYTPVNPEPVVAVKRQQQKFTGVLDLQPTTSSNIFDNGTNKYTSSTSNEYLSPLPTRLSNEQLGDYYNDFTSDDLLNSVTEPYRSKVLQIKSRIRGWKKSGIFSKSGIHSTAYKQVGYA